MTVYELRVNDINYRIITNYGGLKEITSPRDIILKEGFLGYTVLLSVKGDCDVSLNALYFDGRDFYSPSKLDVLLGFFAFWQSVRGAPVSEIDLIVNGEKCNNVSSSTCGDFICISFNKCKQFCTYKIDFQDGTRILINETCIPLSVKLVECTSPESFDMSTLRALRLRGKGSGSCAAFAAAQGEARFVSSSHFLFDTGAAFAIASLLLSEGRLIVGEALKACSGSRFVICSPLEEDKIELCARFAFVSRKELEAPY